MNTTPHQTEIDADIRYYIYQTFSPRTRPPNTLETAQHLNIQTREAEEAFTRLAQSHNISLAPGSHSIWMAHPFSAIPTNYVAEIGESRFAGN